MELSHCQRGWCRVQKGQLAQAERDLERALARARAAAAERDLREAKRLFEAMGAPPSASRSWPYDLPSLRP